MGNNPEQQIAQQQETIAQFQPACSLESYTPSILIDGMPGVGKTHLACTAPVSPIYLIDTDGRSRIPASRFRETVFAYETNSMDDITDKIRALSGLQMAGQIQPSTIVIDSASDLLDLAGMQLQRDHKKSGYAAGNPKPAFGQLSDMIMTPLRWLKHIGFMVILTGRFRHEYVDGNPTGRFVPNIIDQIPYWVDIHLRIVKDSTKNKHVIRVLKNGFSLPSELSFDQADLKLILNQLREQREAAVSGGQS